MKYTKFCSGLFWGAVFGALAGYMNAPQNGKKTREDIKRIIDTTTEDIDDIRYKYDNLLVALHRLAKEGIEGTKDTIDDLQLSFEHFEEEASPRIKRIQKSVDQLTDSIDEVKSSFES